MDLYTILPRLAYFFVSGFLILNAGMCFAYVVMLISTSRLPPSISEIDVDLE